MRAPRRLLLARALTHPRATSAAGPPSYSGGKIDAPPGQLGSGDAFKGSSATRVGNHTLDASIDFARHEFVQRCPGAEGKLPGDVGIHWETGVDAPLPRRLRVHTNLASDLQADVSGQVGADGRLRDYDLAIDLLVEVRLRVLGPAGLVHGTPGHGRIRARIVLVGLRPDTPPDRILRPETLDRFEIDLLAEGFEGDRAACLKAVFDPADLGKLDPGAKRDVGVAVRATADDQEQSMDLVVSATGASASANQVHAAPDRPGRVSITAAAKEQPIALTVNGTSIRGRVTGSAAGKVEDRPKAWGYSVGFAGQGNYSEDRTYDDANSNRRDHHRTAFEFQGAWPRIVIPADGSAPLVTLAGASSGKLSGTVASYGSKHVNNPLSDASYTCNAPLADLNARPGVLPLTIDAAPGPPLLTVRAVTALQAGPGPCTTEGTGFQGIIPATGGVGINDTAVGLQARVAIPAGAVGQASFSMPVQGPGIPFHCSGGNTGGSTCTHTLAWSGRVAFVKNERCEPVGAGYACKPL
jgi:hypothetical protein